VSKPDRKRLAGWLIVGGAVVLFCSLFLTWSHQFSSGFLAQFGQSVLLAGVPHDPTAWQVYSVVDVLLAALAVALVAVALFGHGRTVRWSALVAAAVALAFTLHALAVPPTNGADIFDRSLSAPNYASPGATAGLGETVAIIGLVAAIIGLAVALTADDGRRR
jgi:carbon starvation protein CstA